MVKYRNYIIPILLISIAIGIYTYLKAQQNQSLNKISIKNLEVHYSEKVATRAQKIGSRTNSAMAFFNPVFQFNPKVNLMVLNKTDWQKHTQMPVYGMPHYSDGSLFVAAEENRFWSGFLPSPDQLPKNQSALIKNTYSDNNGIVTMKKFFDLVAIHELGHSYHLQADVNMQRKWLQELFANVVMYTFVAEKEPEMIPIIEVFSNMVVNKGTVGFSYVSLQEFEIHYEAIANQAPQNYGWYQSKLNLFAKKIYEIGGTELIQRLWNALKREKSTLSDPQLYSLLRNTLGDPIASELEAW